jgi:hypothetical protein
LPATLRSHDLNFGKDGAAQISCGVLNSWLSLAAIALPDGEHLNVYRIARSAAAALASARAAFDGVQGAYVMVLDRYKQAYIGQAWDIRARIKRHWSGTKQFDRLIFPDKETSVLSIDSFRALDTTRIFAAKTGRGLELEQRLLSTFPLISCSTVSRAETGSWATDSSRPRSSGVH